MISKKKLREMVDLYYAYGVEKAAELLGIQQDSLKRYLRKAATEGILNEKNRVLKELSEIYSHKELAAMTKSSVIEKPNSFHLNFGKNRFRALVIGDTHIGSKYTINSYITDALKKGEDENVDYIFHVGDLVEGMSNRPGHIYELSELGYDQQKEKAIELFKDIHTDMYIIDGNHDRWYIKSSGALIVKDVADQIEKMHFIGHDEGSLFIDNINVMLWHGEDGSCFDNKTEIQTKNGWKLFTDLTMDDYVATMTKNDHTFQWQKPIDIYNDNYKGKMYHFNSRTVDSMVTPNHGMWTKATNVKRLNESDMTHPTKSHPALNTNWHRLNAEDLANTYSKQKWQFTKAVNKWIGKTPEYIEIPYRESKNKGNKVHHYGKLNTFDVAELIAWYVTEGHARKSSITISQYENVNKKNHTQIINLMNRIGGKYVIKEKNIRIGSMELSEWIKKECGHLSRNKFLPQWIKDSDSDLLQVVFDTLIKGDGWIRNNKTNNSFGYRSISPKLLNDVAEIAIKLGFAVKFNKDTIYITNDQVFPTVNNKPKEIEYDGTIHCCEVPNGLIHVRRNGKTLWTHNSYAHSYRIQKLVESLQGGEKPHILLTGHVHKSIYVFERNIQTLACGAMQFQSKWMRGKRLPAHTGFWIFEVGFDETGVKEFVPRWFPIYK